MNIGMRRVVGVAIVVAAIFAIVVPATQASSNNWVSSQAPSVIYDTPQTDRDICRGMWQMHDIEGETEQQKVCVTEGGPITFGYYTSAGRSLFVVGFSADPHFYRIDSMGTNSQYDGAIYLPNSDTVVVRESYSSTNYKLNIYRNFASRLHRVTGEFFQYQVDVTNPVYTFAFSNGQPRRVNKMAVSHNEKWLIFEAIDTGILTLNMQSFTIKRIQKEMPPYNQGFNPVMELGITNDGQHAAVMGINMPVKIYDIPSTCGDVVTDDLNIETPQAHPCPSLDVATFSDSFITNLGFGYIPEFDDEGNELTFFAASGQQGVQPKSVTLGAPGYTPAPKLDYLALGDSYSSGEGDTEDMDPNPFVIKKSYRPYTDNEENKNAGIPREKCHISTRSYPYILSAGMSLGSPTTIANGTKWQSVACSGASTIDVIPEDQDSDRGQDSRLLGFNNYMDLKAQALNEFIPGRQKQIEFVKKHKPKVITLTMGGNDLGFGGKITACAIPSLTNYTCDIATEAGRPGLGQLIKEQYGNLKTLYEQLYTASGNQAKIYVLGYPQFMNGSKNASCGYNIGILDDDEREMIQKSVEYFNNVIEQAANAAGVKYINIEDSLEGGRLCDKGQKYVTGVAALGNQESFHPNAKGHFEIAMTVWDNVSHESLLDYNNFPSAAEKASATKDSIVPPDYFKGAAPQATVKYKQMTARELTRSELMSIKTAPYTFAPGSKVDGEVKSDPISLGEYFASSDGSLNIEVAVPAFLPAGYHTLILTGQTYSGEPIQYEQVFLLLGSNPTDRDENGTLDSQQVCGLFLVPANVDADQDSIDDACDPEIGDPPLPQDPYRLRPSDPAKSENAAHLYLERNIHATTKTGITGDVDTDGDGWVVVASTAATATTALNLQTSQYARFWIGGPDGSLVPHLSFRTKENGCVQYKPANLAKVIDAAPRVLQQEATDTNTCRSEAATADTDNDGTPDNTQQLYRARNGDASKGEDPKRVYLERSTRAAEAQLGKSDYAANASTPTGVMDTTDRRAHWSLLATTPSSFYTDTFKRLTVINNQPLILARNNLGICNAFKPQSTATIKASTQTSRQLQVDYIQTAITQLQGGC